jgi:hypothetical protein
VPADQPLITLAVQSSVGRRAHRIWNLYSAAGALVGWSVDLPREFTTQPTAIAYRTGISLNVQFAPYYRSIPLD